MTDKAPMTPDLAETFLKRIESAIDDIREQGFGHPSAWYALDRFQAIAEAAKEAANHPTADGSGVLLPDYGGMTRGLGPPPLGANGVRGKPGPEKSEDMGTNVGSPKPR